MSTMQMRPDSAIHRRLRLQVSRRGLLKRLLQFNYALASDIHDSWQDLLSGPQELISRLRQRPRGNVQLTRQLNVSTGFTPLAPGDFVDVRVQVALLPGTTLIRLIHLCTAALLCEPICSELSRQRRIELEQALPPDVLLFARHRCRLTAGPQANGLLAEFLPSVADKLPSWPSRIEETCCVVCGSLWVSYPTVISQRARLKLPRTWQPASGQFQPLPCSAAGAIWPLALRLLETELLKDWNRCFN